ncbi:hydroxymethylglutaryl-CoA lyase [Martelella mediterranea]|uniref:hydroxymethylglutaryl-CoA lyase n=1 Tax=Martelella mediterranea TaxID=293089 RepID=UPI001E5B0905|nr:hydroxymethylglutaryl-CoA lyase [Martelella mediterranea]MCD1633319.1 hydroxymethylglutaryl-CoA lyase [Martelella mediterranea]
MEESRKVTIVEVGPRDGLQNEKAKISTRDKLALIRMLSEAGFSRIEATAFVSPKWVPQMADHDAVMRGAQRRPGLLLSALVPNEKGAVAAIAAGAQELAVFASASETFAEKNTNCTIAESIARFRPVLALAGQHGLPVRGYVSCAVDCPYEGAVAPEAVRDVCERLLEIGCSEVAVADTIGRATPARTDRMLSTVMKSVVAERLACHFHDTSGMALANIDIALAGGIRVFDSAAGGLGGCPYAPGAAGNLASGRLVRHLSDRGFVHGVNSEALERAEQFAARLRLAARD